MRVGISYPSEEIDFKIQTVPEAMFWGKSFQWIFQSFPKEGSYNTWLSLPTSTSFSRQL